MDDRPRITALLRACEAREAARARKASAGQGCAGSHSNKLAQLLAAKTRTAEQENVLDKKNKTPFDRMDDCRKALAYLDGCGWNRSFHQRLFHEDFLKACTRIFWKLEKPGQFARDHQKVLLANNWEHLAQEVLISTPRRFGKTISVSMFAAAMLFAAPNVELSIYSTCKRISQKLLRNVIKFFYEMCQDDLEAKGFKVVRQNMEEIVVRGPEGVRDNRVVNSYPSKVSKARSTQSEYSRALLPAHAPAQLHHTLSRRAPTSWRCFWRCRARLARRVGRILDRAQRARAPVCAAAHNLRHALSVLNVVPDVAESERNMGRAARAVSTGVNSWRRVYLRSVGNT